MPRSERLKARTLMRPYALVQLYRRRLRVHAAQELFAAVGVAIAVALVFAATVAESSIAGSSAQVVRTVAGPASLQLRSRGDLGFDGHAIDYVEHLPGVEQAAPILEQTATVRAPGGRLTSIDLAGTDASLGVLDGLGETLPLAALTPGTIGLTRATASALGLTGRDASAGHVTVVLEMRGRATKLRVSAILGQEAVGALSHALVAVMPLERMQQLSGLSGRITRIFVQTRPGARETVRSQLRAIDGGRLVVAAADQDVALLREALAPSRLASGLFAAIGALLGLLLAFNAMLLTVPDRRQEIADLRLAGTRRVTIVQMVLFQALCLGICASLVGLLAGYVLSTEVFHQSSAYLAQAFTLASNTVVGLRPLLLAFLGGVLTTCLASAVVLLDLRRGRARDAVYQQEGVAGDALGRTAGRRLFAASAALLATATALYALLPSATIAASAMLALGTVLAVPLALRGALALMGLVSDHYDRLITLPVVLPSLRNTTVRSLALAATGAVALFGSVSLGGSRENLQRGIRAFAHNYVAAADVWITNPGDNQAVNTFAPGRDAARVARVAAVAGVQSFQGSFLQLGSRRVWIIARPPGASRQVLSSEILHGDTNTAVAHLGEDGWIAVSKQVADEHHARVGSLLTLPTPSGDVRFRIAATTTNLAWPPGVIFIDSSDYARAWGTSAPTALAVNLRPGANVDLARGAIASALGRDSGLEVATAAERESHIDALTSEGLGQLQEIAMLLGIAAIAAMTSALGSSLWQRREWLAALRLSGARPRRLRRILLLEAGAMLGAGCLTGAITGIYGEIVIDGFLQQVTGFPLAHIVFDPRPLEILVVVPTIAVAIMVIPGWLASHVSPGLALENDWNTA
jgi:putative ABC transport system permease protein